MCSSERNDNPVGQDRREAGEAPGCRAWGGALAQCQPCTRSRGLSRRAPLHFPPRRACPPQGPQLSWTPLTLYLLLAPLICSVLLKPGFPVIRLWTHRMIRTEIVLKHSVAPEVRLPGPSCIWLNRKRKEFASLALCTHPAL